MEDMRTLYDELVAIGKKNAAVYDDSKSKQETLEDFIKRNTGGPRKNLLPAVARTNVASRNDVRTDPFVSEDVVDVPPGTNIYESSRFHMHAARALGGLASRQSGWGDSNPSDSRERFQAYLRELVNAPHWFLTKETVREVQHSSTNHQQFTIDLVNIVEDMMRSANAGEAATAAAASSVRVLATLISNGNDNDLVRDTLYAVIGVSRASPTEPVLYSVFFMELEMRHNVNGKSNVLSATMDAYALILQLDSPMLIRYADTYDYFDRLSVEDWIIENLKR